MINEVEFSGKVLLFSGQQPILLALLLAINHLGHVAGFGCAIAKGALKCLPRLLINLLVLG